MHIESPVATISKEPAGVAPPVSSLPDTATTVYFAFGSTALSAEASTVIDAISEKLNDRHSTVLLVGRSGDLASNEYSIAVSGKRVAVIEAELLKRGVRRTQIRKRLLGKGSFNSRECDSKACRQASRSVELQVDQ